MVISEKPEFIESELEQDSPKELYLIKVPQPWKQPKFIDKGSQVPQILLEKSHELESKPIIQEPLPFEKDIIIYEDPQETEISAPIPQEGSERAAAAQKYRELSRKIADLRREQGILSPEYIQARDILIRAAFNPQEGRPVKKVVIAEIASLASKGFDPEFVRVLSKIVRGMRKQDSEKLYISSEQAISLKILRSLDSPDSNKILCQLLSIQALDPRIKKLILVTLGKRVFFPQKIKVLISDFLLTMDSREIRWDFFEPIAAIASMPSRQLREDAIKSIESVFARLYKEPDEFSRISREVQRVPKELVLQVSELAERIKVPLEKFNLLFLQIEDAQVREEIIFLLTNLINDDGIRSYGYGELAKSEKVNVILRPIMECTITAQTIPHFLSVLRKSLLLINITVDRSETFLDSAALIFFERNLGATVIESVKSIMTGEGKIDSASHQSSPSKLHDLQQAPSKKTIVEIDRAARAEIAKTFGNIFPKNMVGRDQIEGLMGVWEDVDPLLVYAVKLSGRSDKRPLNLMGEIIAHLDPPEMKKWKAWRYNTNDSIVQNQIGFLSENAREKYAKDRIVEMSDALIGIDLTDNPKKIRAIVIEGFLGHQDHVVQSQNSWALQELTGFFKEMSSSHPQFERAVNEKIEKYEQELLLLQEVISLKSDARIASRASQTLGKWRSAEELKQRRLEDAGIYGVSTAQDVENQIATVRINLSIEEESRVRLLATRGVLDQYEKLLKESKTQDEGIEKVVILEKQFEAELGQHWKAKLVAFRKLNLLATCSPKSLDTKLQAFLINIGLDNTATADDIESKWAEKSARLDSLLNSETFKICCKNIGIGADNEKELYSGLENIRAAIIILRLVVLDPELIAHGKLSAGKIDSELQPALDIAQKYFAKTPVLGEIERIRDILGRTSETTKEKNLLFVFTDNPLIGLTVGRYPAGAQSCQKYWHGADTLAAYPADSMTKFCLLIDKSKLPDDILIKIEAAQTEDERLYIFNKFTNRFLEAIAARRVVKVVKKTKDDGPALFLEPIYTPYDRKQMTKYMNVCAKSILEKEIGLSLVRGGRTFGVRVAGSRNTEQYEDGEMGGPDNGGLGSKEGDYNMMAQDIVQSDYR